MNRFWSKVVRGGASECWPWQAARTQGGYGAFQLYSRTTARAHRVAYWLHHGVWPGEVCMHTCDNRLCCNPEHLRDSTNAENMADMAAKKRGRKADGERNNNAKLTWQAVRDIRANWALCRTSSRELAARFGVTMSNIRMILNETTWKESA